MDICIIAAVSKNRVIGNMGKMPWHIPEDLKRFRRLTINHPVIMGRRTYESIISTLGRSLSQRTNIVLSRDLQFNQPGIVVARTLEHAILLGQEEKRDVYIIGGEKVYQAALSYASKLFLTEVKGNYEGDAFFPDYKKEDWTEVFRENHEGFSFVDYVR